MLEINPNNRWDIEQVDNEIKRLYIQSKDIFQGK